MSKRVVLGIWLGYFLIAGSVFGAGGTLPGLGTQTEPYRIEDIDDLQTFSNPANEGIYWAAGVYTCLEVDLNLSGVAIDRMDRGDGNGGGGGGLRRVFERANRRQVAASL